MLDTTITLYYGNNGESPVDENAARARLKEMRMWLKENNVKCSFTFCPIWAEIPVSVDMSAEDAAFFKLRYGL